MRGLLIACLQLPREEANDAPAKLRNAVIVEARISANAR